MILWIVLGYLGAALLAFRFWSMPTQRTVYLKDLARWKNYNGYSSMKPWYPSYVLLAVGAALGWPAPALYRLLWPKGIDAKAKKEEMKAKVKEEFDSAVKEAERIAKEFGLKNPEE